MDYNVERILKEWGIESPTSKKEANQTINELCGLVEALSGCVDRHEESSDIEEEYTFKYLHDKNK